MFFKNCQAALCKELESARTSLKWFDHCNVLLRERGSISLTAVLHEASIIYQNPNLLTNEKYLFMTYVPILSDGVLFQDEVMGISGESCTKTGGVGCVQGSMPLLSAL